jgi:hypothetical protein
LEERVAHLVFLAPHCGVGAGRLLPLAARVVVAGFAPVVLGDFFASVAGEDLDAPVLGDFLVLVVGLLRGAISLRGISPSAVLCIVDGIGSTQLLGRPKCRPWWAVVPWGWFSLLLLSCLKARNPSLCNIDHNNPRSLGTKVYFSKFNPLTFSCASNSNSKRSNNTNHEHRPTYC